MIRYKTVSLHAIITKTKKEIMKKTLLFVAAALLGCMQLNAQSIKLNGVYQNNRYNDYSDEKKDDPTHFSSVYFGNYSGHSIFMVSQGLYTMSWNGSNLTEPVKEPPVNWEEFYNGQISLYGNAYDGEITDMEKALWATNFNLMEGNSGAVYVNGQIVTVHSRDEQSTVDEELFRVCKWDAKTGNLLSSEIHPKSDCLESAGMSYNPKDGKVYGLFYITGLPLPTEATQDPEYFEDPDDDMTDGDAGYAICTIDLKTMTLTRITPGVYYDNFVTFAINSEGRAFALTSGGSNGYLDEDGKIHNIDGKLAGAQLYEFDLKTGRKKLVEVEAVDPETKETYTDYVNTYDHGTGYCSQAKRQAACFSKSNPFKMYWVGYFNSGKGINEWGSWSTLPDKEWRTNGKYDTCLYEVDILTGDARRLAMIDGRFTFSALWVDGDDNSDDGSIDDITDPDIDIEKDFFIILSTSDNGGIWQLVEKDKEYSYYLEPAVGWKIHSVTFNNQDVTANVKDNIYTTPTITQKQSTLFVVFEEENHDSGVLTAKVSDSQVKVLGITGGIRIVGAKSGDQVQIYGVDGRLVTSQTMDGRTTDITLGSKNLYIIKVAGKVVKVRL